jgi:hypothetical protein
MDALQIQYLNRKDISLYLIDLAKLRITVFRDYPCLYLATSQPMLFWLKSL